MAKDFLIAPEWHGYLPRVSFMTHSRQKKLLEEPFTTVAFGVSYLTADEWPAYDSHSFKRELILNLGWFFVSIGLGKLK